jgi:glycosyltransferase involved in cell wall biosynthesis
MSQLPKLAIVIPLYKHTFFAETLDSLCAQTNKNFNVYIGDDCCPHPINNIIEKYNSKLNILYHRYSHNVGGINPVLNWNRCLDLVKNEDWVCVLPDDDMLSEGVVEEFYQNVERATDLPIFAFKLGLKEIIKNGEINSIPQGNYDLINNYQFFLNLVRGLDVCSLGDVIYNKKKLLESGKFIQFPKAWTSDHITAINALKGGLMCRLINSNILFRMSGQNISSQVTDGSEKMKARYLIGKWLLANKNIWDTIPSKDLYKFFYWKSEYYFIHIWRFSISQYIYLLKLSFLFNKPFGFIPPIKALFIKSLNKVSKSK